MVDIIKLSGLVMICISSTVIGVYWSAKIKFHINDLQKINYALSLLKSEIDFSMKPLDEATEIISLQSTNFIQKMFREISNEVREKLRPANKIWMNCSERILSKSYIDTDDLNLIKSFASVISNLDSTVQIKTLEGIQQQLQKKILLLESRYCSEKRLYCNLGFLFGLLVAIILI